MVNCFLWFYRCNEWNGCASCSKERSRNWIYFRILVGYANLLAVWSFYTFQFPAHNNKVYQNQGQLLVKYASLLSFLRCSPLNILYFHSKLRSSAPKHSILLIELILFSTRTWMFMKIILRTSLIRTVSWWTDIEREGKWFHTKYFLAHSEFSEIFLLSIQCRQLLCDADDYYMVEIFNVHIYKWYE